jgi:hypothetical protein
VDGRRRPRRFVATIGRNRTGQRALPTGNNPHTGEQFLTGGTKEDFVEALRAGRLRPRTTTLGPEAMSNCFAIPATPATGVRAFDRDGGDAGIGGD